MKFQMEQCLQLLLEVVELEELHLQIMLEVVVEVVVLALMLVLLEVVVQHLMVEGLEDLGEEDGGTTEEEDGGSVVEDLDMHKIVEELVVRMEVEEEQVLSGTVLLVEERMVVVEEMDQLKQQMAEH